MANPNNTRVVPISLGFVNAYALVSEGAVLVDTGNTGHGPRILKALAQAGIAPTDIRLILITHAHTDHLGGLIEIVRQSNAPVAIQREEAPALREGTGSPVVGLRPVGRLMASLTRVMGSAMGAPPTMEPQIIIEDTLDLTPYGVAGRAIHTPGHTPGSVSVLLDSGDALVGDLIMGQMMTRGRPTYPLFGISREAVRRSVERTLNAGAQVIYAAHGGRFEAVEVARAFGLEPASTKRAARGNR